MAKFDHLIQEIRSLDLQKGSFALFGSAPMAARGLRDATHDIDIIVSEELWDSFKTSPGWILRSIRDDSYLEWSGHDIELWKSWWPGDWDIRELIEEAEIINGLPFVSLEAVLKWKKLIGRPKDLVDVGLIEDYLESC